MKYFSMPADFNHETIDKYHALNLKYKNANIVEVYGQITVGGTAFAAARNTEELNNVDLDFLKEYITYLKQYNMNFNYTLNGTCSGNLEFSEDGLRLMFAFLKKLYNAGVSAVTVAMPTLLEVVKKSGYDFKIKASTL